MAVGIGNGGCMEFKRSMLNTQEASNRKLIKPIKYLAVTEMVEIKFLGDFKGIGICHVFRHLLSEGRCHFDMGPNLLEWHDTSETASTSWTLSPSKSIQAKVGVYQALKPPIILASLTNLESLCIYESRRPELSAFGRVDNFPANSRKNRLENEANLCNRMTCCDINMKS
jgi:hypothetical protein